MVNVLARGDRVLLLGSSGFIGGHVQRALAGAGIEVVRFDLVPDPTGAQTELGDVRDAAALSRALRGCTAVLNLAAAHHDFGISESTFEGVNVGGARAVTTAMDEHGLTNLCFLSSVAVYGELPGEPDERTEPAPAAPYGRTKLAAEVVYRQWQQQGPDRRALIIRPAVVFGQRHYANVFRLIQQIDRGRFVSVGDGRNRKSMAVVTNLVAAIVTLWGAPAQAGQDGRELYNYADKPDLISRQVVSTIYDALGKREPRWRIPLGLAVAAASPLDLLARVTGKDMPVTSARIRRLAQFETCFSAQRVLSTGFAPPVPLSEGLRDMVQWYRSEGRDSEPVVRHPPEHVVRHDPL